MAKRNEVPKCGLLSGVKVVFSGNEVAGPSARWAWLKWELMQFGLKAKERPIHFAWGRA